MHTTGAGRCGERHLCMLRRCCRPSQVSALLHADQGREGASCTVCGQHAPYKVKPCSACGMRVIVIQREAPRLTLGCRDPLSKRTSPRWPAGQWEQQLRAVEGRLQGFRPPGLPRHLDRVSGRWGRAASWGMLCRCCAGACCAAAATAAGKHCQGRRCQQSARLGAWA